MPLVIMCGYPSSGKTRRVGELIAFLTQHYPERQVSVVSEDSENVYAARDKSAVYADSKAEKEVRALLKSAVLRLLSKEGVVILDSLNYIKGYRYELYCASKSAHTTHCVVHCDTSEDMVRQWNQIRNKKEQYDPSVLNALCMRFEEPIGSNRWDSPLFSIQIEDTLPARNIAAALFDRKPPPPNMSTLTQPLEASNFLFDLDRKTQEVVKEIFQAQRGACHGEALHIEGSSENFVLKNRVLQMPELRKWRQQFLTYSKMHPPENTDKIATLFVQYLNNGVH